MERYGLRLPDLFGGEEALRERIAAKLVPPAVRTQLDDASAQAETLLDSLDASLRGFDSNLSTVFQKSRRKILYQLTKISAKAAREAFRRDERAQAAAAWLAHLLYPHRRPQERFYSLLPFLASHGPGLIARLLEEVRLDSLDHRVVLL